MTQATYCTASLKDTRTVEYLEQLGSQGRIVIDTHSFFEFPPPQEQRTKKQYSIPPLELDSCFDSLGIYGLAIPANISQNRFIPEIFKETKRIKGAYLNFNPNRFKEKEFGYISPEEAEQIAHEDHRIVGLKVIPTLYRCRIDHPCYTKFLEIASRNNLTVLFHRSGRTKHYESEEMLETLAETFSEVPIVSAHGGGFTPSICRFKYIRDAVDHAEGTKNLFLNLTSLNPFKSPWDLNTLDKRIGFLQKRHYTQPSKEKWSILHDILMDAFKRIPEKFFLGTDLGFLDTLSEFSLWPIYDIEDRETEDKILSKNALEVFKLKV